MIASRRAATSRSFRRSWGLERMQPSMSSYHSGSQS